MSGSPIPVNVLTGFLGSGKTSLLQRSIASPALRNAAVIINEFGELGLDHLLVETIENGMVLLQSGCVCCTVREDLGQALRDLYERRADGRVPAFDRVVIETTGLADPAPVVATLLHEPVVRHHYRAANVIVTVDIINLARHLAEAPEATKQIAMADRVVVTKTDIAEPGAFDRAAAAIAALNGVAPITDVAQAEAESLFARDAFEPGTRAQEIASWLAAADGDAGHPHHGGHGHEAHGAVQTFAVETREPIDWALFGIWLSMLLHRHGERVLRVKGILLVEGSETPVVVNGVQHLIHPPVHLETWPCDRCSKIVFIVRDLDAEAVRRSLLTFCRIAA